MCHLPSNPLHTIIEVSELFQAFLKHASIDGFVESWCLEIRLRSSAGAVPSELPVDCMHHLVALHSLNYFILKRLDERHHELTMECCSCGWEVSHIPEFQHSEVNRYTPGTVIRWSQGECHVLLAPSSTRYDSVSQELAVDPLSDTEEIQKEDTGEAVVEIVNPQPVVREDELPPRSGVIHSTEQRTPCGGREPERVCSPERNEAGEDPNEEPPAGDGVAQDSQYFIKHQHFCEEDADCSANHSQELDTVNEHDIKEGQESEMRSPLWQRQGPCGEAPSPEDAFANGASDDDEENSRMLVINEDDNSQDANATSDASHALTFHRVLPLTTENVRALPTAEKRPLPEPSPRKEDDEDEEEEDSREDDNDDDNEDSSSVSSSSSSSSSSTSSSSSSDDDDRINFKKRVEQAAQAAREAAASAAATTTSFQDGPHPPSSLPFQDGVSQSNDPSNAFASPRYNEISTEQRHDAASFTVYRHPDDIQAAQGLAALGKGHEFPLGEPLPTIGRAPPKTTTSSKIAQKLLQNKTANVRRIGQKSCFQCGVCCKIFSRFYKALEHQVSHTGEKPWECDSCDKKFAKYHSMQKHQRAKHTPAHLQEFKCYICEKNFGLQSALQMHLVTHATLKPFSCSVCGQTFALKFTKEAHEAQHTGNRPWACSVCPKTFITKYKLRAHMKAHTGELFCIICNRTFTSQDAFTRHKRRHETQKDNGADNSAHQKQNSFKRRATPASKGRGRTVPSKGAPTFGSSPLASLSSEFRCQMCNKTFAKSTDLTHHLASCNAITYCPPPSNIHSGIPGSSMLQEGGGSEALSIHQPPEPPPPPPPPDQHHLHHQPLPSTAPLTTCMLIEEKKLSQFTPCATPSDVTENIDGLDRRPYLMNTLPAQSMASVTPYQLQEMVIHTSSNPVPDSLPDYLSEVAFGTVTGNGSTIIFQPANEQG